MIRLHNKSQRRYMHQIEEGKVIVLEPKEIKDVEDEVAKIWMQSKEIEEVGASLETVEGLKARIEELEKAGVEVPKAEAKEEKKKAGRKPKAEAKEDKQSDIEDVVA